MGMGVSSLGLRIAPVEKRRRQSVESPSVGRGSSISLQRRDAVGVRTADRVGARLGLTILPKGLEVAYSQSTFVQSFRDRFAEYLTYDLKMKFSIILKVVAVLSVMSLWVTTVGAAGGDELPSEVSIPGGKDMTLPTGLPDSSEGVPAVAGMPVEEPVHAPAEIPVGGSSDDQSGEAPFDAGEWFDDTMPDYFQPAEADEQQTSCCSP